MPDIWGVGRKANESRGNLARLQVVTKALPENVQAAFLLAAKQGKIKQMTWNGCAFNAGGKIVDPVSHINSYEKAAQIFDCDVTLVRSFIHTWDSHFSNNPTADLITVLTSSDDFSKPAAKRKGEPIVVFKSTMQGLAADFDAGRLSTEKLEELCPMEFRALVYA